MSFGYLIITSKPCDMLTKKRGEIFSLIHQQSNLWAYFRFCEGNIYTERKSESDTCFTQKGVEWIKGIYEANQGGFLFSDVLLQKNEGEVDFFEKVLKVLKNEKNQIIDMMNIKSGFNIHIRKVYQIK